MRSWAKLRPAFKRRDDPRLQPAYTVVEAALQRESDVQRPLIAQAFQTDGLDLFVERYGQMINASRQGQQAMWDTTVRKSLKQAAQAAGCDFSGFGLHSFRRANITWRQEVGGSAIETAKIAGHSTPRITEDYTIVQMKRQEELTRRIQQRLAQAKPPVEEPTLPSPPPPEPPETPPSLAGVEPATHMVQ
ncbi:MAG: site-specific integrase [Bryobacteraceae bacterium]|nr:site-specific integrase [Bryobacteraceae bacterium]